MKTETEEIKIKENGDETHPSFAMLSINKFSGGEATYFGSNILHDGGITLKISSAVKNRAKGYESFYGEHKPLIEVNMSYTQFAEAITSGMNTQGSPCTLKSFNGERISGCNFEAPRIRFEKEFEEHMMGISKKMDKLTEKSEELLSRPASKPLNKSEKTAILNQIAMLKQEVGSNSAFMGTCFNEHMDNVTKEAKSELEGFYGGLVEKLGMEKLQEMLNPSEFKEDNGRDIIKLLEVIIE